MWLQANKPFANNQRFSIKSIKDRQLLYNKCMDDVNFKKCPFCAESVLFEAKKCKHCGETIDIALRVAEEAKRNASVSPTVFMNTGGGPSSSSSSSAATTPNGSTQNTGCGCLFLIIIAVFVILCIYNLIK
jgi:hypothetical protein